MAGCRPRANCRPPTRAAQTIICHCVVSFAAGIQRSMFEAETHPEQKNQKQKQKQQRNPNGQHKLAWSRVLSGVCFLFVLFFLCFSRSFSASSINGWMSAEREMPTTHSCSSNDYLSLCCFLRGRHPVINVRSRKLRENKKRLRAPFAPPTFCTFG